MQSPLANMESFFCLRMETFYFYALANCMEFDFTKALILENEQVLLRPLLAEDSRHLLPVATAHMDLVLYSPYKIHTPESLQQFVQASLADRERQLRYPFVVYNKPTNEYAGSTPLPMSLTKTGGWRSAGHG